MLPARVTVRAVRQNNQQLASVAPSHHLIKFPLHTLVHPATIVTSRASSIQFCTAVRHSAPLKESRAAPEVSAMPGSATAINGP